MLQASTAGEGPGAEDAPEVEEGAKPAHSGLEFAINYKYTRMDDSAGTCLGFPWNIEG